MFYFFGFSITLAHIFTPTTMPLPHPSHSLIWCILYTVVVSPKVQVFAIEFVTFAVDFIPFAVEFIAFAIEFGLFALEFISFAIEFVGFAIEFGALALEFIAFAQKLVIVTLAASNQLLIARRTVFTRENTT